MRMRRVADRAMFLVAPTVPQSANFEWSPYACERHLTGGFSVLPVSDGQMQALARGVEAAARSPYLGDTFPDDSGGRPTVVRTPCEHQSSWNFNAVRS